jgi:hypothetical protein
MPNAIVFELRPLLTHGKYAENHRPSGS